MSLYGPSAVMNESFDIKVVITNSFSLIFNVGRISQQSDQLNRHIFDDQDNDFAVYSLVFLLLNIIIFNIECVAYILKKCTST